MSITIVGLDLTKPRRQIFLSKPCTKFPRASAPVIESKNNKTKTRKTVKTYKLD